MDLFIAELTKQTIISDFDKNLIPDKNEDIVSYMRRISEDEKNYDFINRIMKFACHWLDYVKCPFRSWKEDVKYYNKMERAFDLPVKDGIDRRLQRKLIHHIQKNITHSINVNRTSAEIYSGWDDE